MRQTNWTAGGGLVCLFLAVGVAWRPPPAPAQDLSADDAALVKLNAARRAYNEGKYELAAKLFGEFLKDSGGHRQAPAAHYGLGLSLLAGADRDYEVIRRSLGEAARRRESADRPFALYYLAVATRGLAADHLSQAAAKPKEAQNYRNNAMNLLAEAGRTFGEAADLFAARAKAAAPAKAPEGDGPPAGKPALPPDLDWMFRCRCCQCEMDLRTNRLKEARETAEALLAHPAIGAGEYRQAALYHLGYARFAAGEYHEAGRALSRLAPFDQEFGTHARYLLARCHQAAGERPEAVAQYDAILQQYEDARKQAERALRNPRSLDAGRKAALELLVKGPPPDYVGRALFYKALLLAEQGWFDEALASFSTFLHQYPQFPLAREALLRKAYCQIELKNFVAAIKSLEGLRDDAELADRALWWLARAQVASANPGNEQAYAQQVAAALDNFRKAAEIARRASRSSPAGRLRYADILMATGDAQQLLKQYKEAAETYRRILAERPGDGRTQQAMQRQATALHLAGAYAESDRICQEFERAYPDSTLLGAVLFRAAENAYMMAVAAEKDPRRRRRGRDPRRDVERLLAEAVRRYQRMLAARPAFAQASLARQGMASAYYRLGRYAEAAEGLRAIPDVEQTGELATVPYLLADCIIRTLPARADDAVQAALLAERAKRAAKLLERFTAMGTDRPEAPDALLKLGYCYQRAAEALAGAKDRQELLAAARGAYERFMQAFAKDPSLPRARFDWAKCVALMGDVQTAVNELRRFAGEPFRRSEVAPLALMQASALLRSQNRAREAADVMKACRAQHEAELLKDPNRKAWAAMLRYEHAMAVMAGDPAAAAAMFIDLAGAFPACPEGRNAVWRVGQCRRQVLAGDLAKAQQVIDRPGARPEDVAAARQAMAASFAKVRQTIDLLDAGVENAERTARGREAHLRMLYELAWCYRLVADVETQRAHAALKDQALKTLQDKLAAETPEGEEPAALPAPYVPFSAVPLQPSEVAARKRYRMLIAAAPASAMAAQARLELAELLARRGKADEAVALLADALEHNPPAAIADPLNLRLAAALLARNDTRAALRHIDAVSPDAAGLPGAERLYLMGELYVRQQSWAEAIKNLSRFRDDGALQNIPGVTDRALLRLGHAYARTGEWEQSRRAFEVLVQRFGGSLWLCEAYYGMGQAWQQQRRYNEAVGAYAQVTRRTVADIAAKAQIQVGLCLMAQERHAEAVDALLTVPCTYAYPARRAQALCEAARAHLAMKAPAAAAKLLRRVIAENADAEWVRLATQRLDEIK